MEVFMKKRNLFAVAALMSGLVCSAVFTSTFSKQGSNKVKADTPILDHYLGAFNNANILDNCGAPKSNSTNFSVVGTDPTSDVSLKFSSGRYKEAEPYYLKLGYDSETASTAAAASINVSEDEDFQGVWSAVSSKLSSYSYINAVITEQAISNIQDIAVTWRYVENVGGVVCFVYQLEDENSWTLLLRDDGESGKAYWSYPIRSANSGVSGTYNRFGAYSASYNGTSEPVFHGQFNDFSKNLRGKTAKIGFVFALKNSDHNAYNYMQIGSILINRSKSIKALVRAVQGSQIANSGDYYERLVDMCGYKMLQSHANSLIEEHNSTTYFAEFDDMYYAYKGSQIGLTPTSHDVTLYYESTDTNFTYDGKRHEPTFYFLDEDNHSIYLKWNAQYTSDVSGYNSSKAPKDPFYYAATFEIDEPYAFNYTGEQKFVVFHIAEASDGSDFLTDWFAARTAGGEAGMCDMLSTPEKQAQLDILIKRYNNNFSAEVKATIGATVDAGEYTIADSITYFTAVLNGEVQTTNYNVVLLSNANKNVNTIIVIAIIALIIASAGLLLFLKKKKEN